MKPLNTARAAITLSAVTLALAILAAPPAQAARSDCEVAARIAERAERGVYRDTYKLAKWIQRIESTKPEAMMSPQLGWKALWKMDADELEGMVEFNAYCRHNIDELLPDKSAQYRARLQDQLRAGTPDLVDGHARAQEIITARKDLRQRVDARLDTRFVPSEARAWFDLARAAKDATRRVSVAMAFEQAARVLDAIDDAARRAVDEMAAADPQGLEDFRELHAQMGGWPQVYRLSRQPAYSISTGGRQKATDIPLSRAANTFAKLRDQAARAHARDLLAPSSEKDPYPRDQAAQRLLLADYPEAKTLDPAYHETLRASLAETAEARRSELKDHLCETGVANAGASDEELAVDVAGTDERPIISLALVVCEVALNGLDATYAEADGWFAGDGFTLTIEPNYDTVDFNNVQSFETLRLAFEPVAAAGEDVYAVVEVDRDGTTEDLDLADWRAMLERLDNMSVGKPDAN